MKYLHYIPINILIFSSLVIVAMLPVLSFFLFTTPINTNTQVLGTKSYTKDNIVYQPKVSQTTYFNTVLKPFESKEVQVISTNAQIFVSNPNISTTKTNSGFLIENITNNNQTVSGVLVY